MTNDADDRFDALLRDAAATYNRPPADGDLPLDAMWRTIEAEAFPTPGSAAAPRGEETVNSAEPRRIRRSGWQRSQWLRIAAALVIGVGIGRISLLTGAGERNPKNAIVQTSTSPTSPTPAVASQYDPSTSRYLGQAAIP